MRPANTETQTVSGKFDWPAVRPQPIRLRRGLEGGAQTGSIESGQDISQVASTKVNQCHLEPVLCHESCDSAAPGRPHARKSQYAVLPFEFADQGARLL